MLRSRLILAALVMSLAGCSGLRNSAFNPFNWFGRAQPAEASATGGNPLIPQRSIFARRQPDQTYSGQPVARIADLEVSRMPGGALVTATGVADRMGAYDVRLVEAGREGGTVSYVLSVLYDPRETRIGPERARLVTAGIKLTNQQLASIRAIRVEGRENALVSRR